MRNARGRLTAELRSAREPSEAQLERFGDFITRTYQRKVPLHWEKDEQAEAKLADARRIQAEYQAKLDAADEEIRRARIKAQQASQQAVEEQLAQAKAQAQQLLVHARTEAEHDREQILRSSQRELRKLATEATKKLAMEKDPFDQFLDLAEEGAKHEER